MNVTNQWSKRLTEVSELDVIVQRSRVAPVPVSDLGAETAYGAAEKIGRTLQEVYEPTKRNNVIIQQLLQMASDHALHAYPSPQTFLSKCYEPVRRDEYFPICCLGPAGTGKSKLMEAIARVVGPATSIEMKSDVADEMFPLDHFRSCTIDQCKSVNDVLHAVSRGHTSGLKGQILKDECARWLYQSGVCLLGVDEMQFLTGSAGANTRIAQMLLSLRQLGIPMVYFVNRSLFDRLEKRPPEERQRLLSSPILMFPESADSECWENVLKAYQKALPEIFGFQLYVEALSLWNYTAGLKRLLVLLLKEAYRTSRHSGKTKISMDDVKCAYLSPSFSINRQDVESMISQAMCGSKKVKSDLLMPSSLGFEFEHFQKYRDQLKDIRRVTFPDALINSALSASEKGALASIQKEGDEKAPKCAAVKGSKKPPSLKLELTAHQLLMNNVNFLNDMK